MTISECVRSSPWWGWSNLWGTIAADRWAWFIRKKLKLNPKSPPGLSSVAFTIANGGMTAGLRVSAFLTSAAVDLVRKRAIDSTVVPPLEPLAALVKDFLSRGGRLWACTPCVKARGYEQSDLIEGVEIAGSSKIHELIKNGAATLSF